MRVRVGEKIPPFLLKFASGSVLIAIGLASWNAPLVADATSDIDVTIGPSGLSLEEAMDAAERHDYAVRASQLAQSEVINRRAQIQGQMGPKLALEGNAVWFNKGTNDLTGETLPNGTAIPEKLTTAALVITQPLIGLGPLWLKAKAESLSNDIAATDIRTAMQDARLRGAEAFIRTLKAQRFFQIASSSLAVLDKQRQDAIALQQQGKLADADIIRFDFALSDGNTLLMQAKSSKMTAVYALIETLGLERSTRSIELQANDSKTWKSQAEALPSLEQLLVDAEKARTDTQAASMRTAAVAYAQRAADYDYAPSLNAFARFERDFQAKDLSMPVLGQNRRVDYDKEDIRDKLSYGLSASWTIWDWGTRRHRSAEFAATVEKAKTQEEAVQSRAHIEVVQAYMELRYASEALASSAASERLGQEVYRSIALKFNNGLSTTTDMLAAERDQARAQLAHANAQGDADLAWLKLQKVIGAKPTIH